MGTLVCHSNPVRWAIVSIMFSGLAAAQTTSLTWHKVGSSAVDLGLAGPAGGPVTQVWFSEDGSRLFVRTPRGAAFVTTNLYQWAAASSDASRSEIPLQRAPMALPEPHVNLREGGRGRMYAFGTHVYASEDEGRTWINLTAFNGRSIIGEAPHDLAASPQDPLSIAVANDSGIWTSHDGGLSWSSLNEGLPNLPAIRALLPGNRIAIDRMGTAILQSRTGWIVEDSQLPDNALKEATSAKLGVNLSAIAGSGDYWYAGSADGRVWTSADARAHWTLSTIQASGPVERFAVDGDSPRIAFVAASGHASNLFRTVNGGLTWGDVTGLLTDAPAHGIAADRANGMVYVATDKGLFLSRMDINALGSSSAWVSLSSGLPKDASIQDVRLDQAGTRLTVAVESFGVYAARAPRSSTERIVNAADFSTRAAAPGGLVTALGIAVESAMANGRQFPVLARSAEGSQIQIPFGTEASEIALQLNRTVTTGLTVKAVSPAVFVDRDGTPLLLDPDTGMMADAAQPTPARALIQLLATGLGRVTPDWPTGTPAPFTEIPAVVADVTAYLDGVPAEVTKATLAPGYVGMYLIEIRIPALLNTGSADLYVVAGGETSNHVRIAVTNN